MLGFDVEISPKGQEFMESRAFVRLLAGPVGSGKSTIAAIEILRLAMLQNKNPRDGVRRSRCIVLRNTAAQLRDTVKPLLNEWFVVKTGGKLAYWKHSEGNGRLYISCFHPDGGLVQCEVMLMAVDTPDDVRRLLSVEASFAFCEEFVHLDRDVFFGLMGRVARYPSRVDGGCAFPCVYGSSNPPMAETFWAEVLENPPEGWDVFWQPPALLEDKSLNPEAENLQFLDPNYYKNLIAGKTDDWIGQFLQNRFGVGQSGQAVYKHTYMRHKHVHEGLAASTLLGYSEQYPVVVGLDNGLTAAAVITQQDARGRVIVAGEAVVPDGETMAFERYFDTILLPALRQVTMSRNVVMVMDPACFQRSQLDARTIAQFVKDRGFQVIKASTNKPDKRIGAVEQLLTTMVGEYPRLVIDKERNPTLIKGFEYGYKYPQRKSGEMNVENGPEKNKFSHVHDALQYAALHYTSGGDADRKRRHNIVVPTISSKAWT